MLNFLTKKLTFLMILKEIKRLPWPPQSVLGPRCCIYWVMQRRQPWLAWQKSHDKSMNSLDIISDYNQVQKLQWWNKWKGSEKRNEEVFTSVISWKTHGLGPCLFFEDGNFRTDEVFTGFIFISILWFSFLKIKRKTNLDL